MSIDDHQKTSWETSLLLRLAVLGDYMTEDQLRRGLRMHEQMQLQRQQIPLSDLLLESGLLDDMDYVDLLASQQKFLGRDQPYGEPIRLTAKQDRLLGELVCCYELVDVKTLEACRLAREAWQRQGINRTLGELLLEIGVLSWGYLRDKLTACGAAELWRLPAGRNGGPVMIEPENASAMRKSLLRALYFSRRRTTRRTVALFQRKTGKRA